METKSKREQMEKIRNMLGFDRNFVVESKGFSGDLALLWNSNVHIVLDSYTNHHISIFVIDPNNGKSWLLIGFYGNPNTTLREAS